MNASTQYRRLERRWRWLAIISGAAAIPLLAVHFPLDFIPAGVAGISLLEAALNAGRADGWEERDEHR